MIINKINVGYLETNCYIISVDNDCLIVDPGAEAGKIISVVGNKNVLAVLITHYHEDHIGVLKDILDKYNCKLIDYKDTKNEYVLNCFEFSKIITKGHTNDSVAYYFKKEKIMFTGDFLFKNNIGRCDLGGNYIDMKNSLNAIRKYNKDITIYPGHGDASTLEDEFKYNTYLKGDINE